MSKSFVWCKPSTRNAAIEGRAKSWRLIDLLSSSNSEIESKFFQLQSYHGTNIIHRSKYRIIMKTNDYVIAHSNNLEDLLQAWKFLNEKLPNLIPSSIMNTPEEEKWIVSFLKELYFERKKNENKDLGSEEVSGETESTKSNEDEDEDKFEEEFDEDREALNRHSSLVLKVLQEEKKSSPLLLASHESPHFRFRRNKTTEDLNEDHEEEASESSLKFLEQLLQLPLLKQIFSEYATRNQRTIKYTILCCIFTFVYTLLVRTVSWDLYLILLIALNAVLYFAIKQRRDLIVWATKRKIRRAKNIAIASLSRKKNS